jgi:hypothetical protein
MHLRKLLRRRALSQNALGSTADQFTVLTTMKYRGLVFRCGGLATALRTVVLIPPSGFS